MNNLNFSINRKYFDEKKEQNYLHVDWILFFIDATALSKSFQLAEALTETLPRYTFKLFANFSVDKALYFSFSLNSLLFLGNERDESRAYLTSV